MKFIQEPPIATTVNLKSMLFSPFWHVRGRTEEVLVLRESGVVDKLGLVVLAIGLFLLGTFLALWTSNSPGTSIHFLYAALVVMAFGAIAGFFKHQIVFNRRTGRFTYQRTPQRPLVLLLTDVKLVQLEMNGKQRDVFIYLTNDMVLWLTRTAPDKAYSLAKEMAVFLDVPLVMEDGKSDGIVGTTPPPEPPAKGEETPAG